MLSNCERGEAQLYWYPVFLQFLSIHFKPGMIFDKCWAIVKGRKALFVLVIRNLSLLSTNSNNCELFIHRMILENRNKTIILKFGFNKSTTTATTNVTSHKFKVLILDLKIWNYFLTNPHLSLLENTQFICHKGLSSARIRQIRWDQSDFFPGEKKTVWYFIFFKDPIFKFSGP